MPFYDAKTDSREARNALRILLGVYDFIENVGITINQNALSLKREMNVLHTYECIHLIAFKMIHIYKSIFR